MENELLNKVKSAVEKAKTDILELGGGKGLRGNHYGVEHHFQWRVMYHFENEYGNHYFQSPEVKTAFKTGKKYDWGIYEKRDLKPLLIAEFKVSWYNEFFNGKKEVEHDFTKLTTLVNHYKQDQNPIPLFGLIYYQEPAGYQRIEKLMAKTSCYDLYEENAELMPHYFEILVDEQKKDVRELKRGI